MRPREAIEASSRALVQTMARGGNSGGGVGREGTEAGNDRRGVKRKMEDAG